MGLTLIRLKHYRGRGAGGGEAEGPLFHLLQRKRPAPLPAGGLALGCGFSGTH